MSSFHGERTGLLGREFSFLRSDFFAFLFRLANVHCIIMVKLTVQSSLLVITVSLFLFVSITFFQISCSYLKCVLLLTVILVFIFSELHLTDLGINIVFVLMISRVKFKCL